MKGKPVPRALKARSFQELLDDAQRRAEEEEAKVAAMTAAQRKAYELELIERNKKVEAILKQLRGPGFMEIHVPRKPKGGNK